MSNYLNKIHSFNVATYNLISNRLYIYNMNYLAIKNLFIYLFNFIKDTKPMIDGPPDDFSSGVGRGKPGGPSTPGQV